MGNAQRRERLIDALHSQSAEAAANGAFVVLDAMQQVGHPAKQVIGLACAFKNICRVAGVEPNELFAIVDKMEADCRYRFVNTLSAVEKYAEHEIARKFL